MNDETQPLTDKELATIRGAIERTDLIQEDTLPLAFTDRKRLLTEVNRLRAENAKIQHDYDLTVNQLAQSNASALRELQALATVDDMEAEVSRLRAQVDEVSTLHSSFTGVDGIEYCEHCFEYGSITQVRYPCDTAITLGVSQGGEDDADET